MALFRLYARNPIVDKRKYSRYISPWYGFTKRKRREIKRIYDRLAKALKILWENGAPIVAGTDIPNTGSEPRHLPVGGALQLCRGRHRPRGGAESSHL